MPDMFDERDEVATQKTPLSLVVSTARAGVGDLPVDRLTGQGRRHFLDCGKFPRVAMEGAPGPENAFAWCAEFRTLLAREQSFVLLAEAAMCHAPASDQRSQARWLSRQTASLQRYCYGLVLIEPDVAQRAVVRLAAVTLFGPAMRIIVVSNAQVAQQLADVLLLGAGGTPGRGARADGAAPPVRWRQY